MDDNKNQNQTNPTASDYQKILDEYAASVKPEDNQTPQNKTEDESISVSLKEAASAKAEPEKPIVPQTPSTLIDDLEKEIIPKIPDEAPEKSSTPELKSINSPQLESPIHPSLAANLESDDEPEKPIADLPSLPPKEDSKPVNIPTPTLPPETPVDVKPEKSPEEIKAEINRLLTDDETKPTSPDISNPTKTSSVGKVFFIFALILFLIIAAGLAYFLFLVPSNTTKNKTDNSTPSVTPTLSETNDNSSNESGICELNNKTYQVGESFTSADGCNTCSCSSAGVIACTEKACAGTPTVTTATKSATTTSSVSSGWKTYNTKINFSISVPSTYTFEDASSQKGGVSFWSYDPNSGKYPSVGGFPVNEAKIFIYFPDQKSTDDYIKSIESEETTKIISQKDLTILGYKAKLIKFTNDVEGGSENMNYIINRNNSIFVISILLNKDTSQTTKDKFYSDFTKIVNTIKFN